MYCVVRETLYRDTTTGSNLRNAAVTAASRSVFNKISAINRHLNILVTEFSLVAVIQQALYSNTNSEKLDSHRIIAELFLLLKIRARSSRRPGVKSVKSVKSNQTKSNQIKSSIYRNESFTTTQSYSILKTEGSNDSFNRST